MPIVHRPSLYHGSVEPEISQTRKETLVNGDATHQKGSHAPFSRVIFKLDLTLSVYRIPASICLSIRSNGCLMFTKRFPFFFSLSSVEMKNDDISPYRVISIDKIDWEIHCLRGYNCLSVRGNFCTCGMA